jgi:hypothetical protein
MSGDPDLAGPSSTSATGLEGSSGSSDVEEQIWQTWRERRSVAVSQRNAHMDDLIRNLDFITSAEIATVYFLE